MQLSVDLMAPEHCRNPYPLYEQLRRSHPVCRVEPGGLIAVSRYKDVEFALKHPELFSSHGFRVLWEPAWVGDNPIAHAPVASDGAEHTRLRGVVQRAFTPAAVARVQDRLRLYAGELADRLREQSAADFMENFAEPIPARALSYILGTDLALEPRYKGWTQVLATVTPVPLSAEHATHTRAAIAEMKGHLQQLIDERRHRPADDVLGLMVRGQVDGQALSDPEIVALCVNLLAAGLETTTFLLGNAMRLLAERPDVVAALRADRKLVPRFLEEMLRYDGPVLGVPRIVMTDTELAGVRIAAGECVFLLIASANRDDSQISEPERFDLHRERVGIPFGAGSHFCLGAHLARIEAQTGLEALLDRFDGFSAVAEGLVWNRALITRGPVKLPVRFQSSGHRHLVDR